MEYAAIDMLRERHPAWRLLRAGNAVLILSFLGAFFVEGNRGASPVSEVADALDDRLYALNAQNTTNEVPARYPKDPRSYLEDWAATDAGFLRRFYPVGDDEIHYEVTPAFEKAYAWVASLQGRSFVGTESRLHTVVELLRQIVHGTEARPEIRLAELHRRRDELNSEIAAVEAGNVTVLDETAVRDRYQQLSSTARELLSDFREVEENFRHLDRAAREKIAAWEGSKGDLLTELVGSRSEIAGSDQGRSFRSFYDFLLSDSRQAELTELLATVSDLAAFEVFTTTGLTQPIEPSARSVRYPNNCAASSMIRSGWRIVASWNWYGRWRASHSSFATTRRRSASTWTSLVSTSHFPSSGRCIRRRRRSQWTATSHGPMRRSMPACSSPRRSSTRPGWSQPSDQCYRKIPRLCFQMSSRCIRWSRAPPRSSAIWHSTTRM